MVDKSKRTPFVKLMVERFADEVYSNGGAASSMELLCDYQLLINAPRDYENEDEMLEYAKAHPDASIKELLDYFDEITPDGDLPCASDWEDDYD